MRNRWVVWGLSVWIGAASAMAAQEEVEGGSGYRPPHRIEAIGAAYTEKARLARIEGVVVVEATVTREGAIRDPKVIEGLSHGLDESALEAVRQWRFEPATLHGKPVEARRRFSIGFRLPRKMFRGFASPSFDPECEPGPECATEPRVARSVVPRPTSGFLGEVEVLTLINRKGKVKDTLVIDTFDPRVEAEAARAVREMRFEPATLDGKPIEIQYVVRVPFSE